jgi:uncharacterized protein DUF4399
MLKYWYCVLTVALAAAAAAPAWAQQSAAPTGAFAYFVNLHDGDTVTSPFKVIFGLSPNMGVAPSGIDKPNVGHHHLLIDTKLTPDELKEAITVDEQHVHFGKGQTETTLTLPPGRHTLQLMLGDWAHVPFDAPVHSEIITINVTTAEAQLSPAGLASSAVAATPKLPHPAQHRHHHEVMVFKAAPMAH